MSLLTRLAGLLALVMLAGCGDGLHVDDSLRSRDHSSRIEFIVIHYTSADLERSKQLLSSGGVSAHYLLPADEPLVYRLVDEDRRAWHAGDSQWRGRTWLNASSIGIELVNTTGLDADGQVRWQPWPSAQIERLVQLLQDLQHRHDIDPRNIVGHSDIAPQRKIDPGPLFPWARLAAAGLIPWPDPVEAALLLPGFQRRLPGVAWFQQQLARIGYAVPQDGRMSAETRNVLAAFQMKYRPARFDGRPDAQTAALLAAFPD